MSERLLIIVGSLIVLAISGIVFLTQIGAKPADVRILEILDENRENLLSVVGVVGAGIARDENNHILGIAVYVEDNLADTLKIPSKLGEFKVYIKSMDEASESEEEGMIIRNTHHNLLNVTTDKAAYSQDDTIVVTIENLSNETFTFGNSAYDLYFVEWNGVSWEPYTGVIGLEVITYLDPEESAKITYQLGGQTDKPFPSGKYCVISEGWLEHKGETVYIWGYAEFTVQ